MPSKYVAVSVFFWLELTLAFAGLNTNDMVDICNMFFFKPYFNGYHKNVKLGSFGKYFYISL